MSCTIKPCYVLIVKYLLLIIWLSSLFILFCKAYREYYGEPEYYYLRQILGNGLCISRSTVPVINFLVAISVLPVCRTFNQIVHKFLQRFSTFLFISYLENVKIIHMTISIGLVLVSVIHSVTHIVNAFNFVFNYDQQHPEINWATSKNDNVLRLLFFTPTGFSGFSMVAILLVIWLFATRKMRDRYYNNFWASHHLFVVFFALMYYHPLENIIKYQTNLMRHNPGCKYNQTTLMENCTELPEFTAGQKSNWIYPSIALFIYFIDSSYRYIRRNSYQFEILESYPLPGHAVHIRLLPIGRYIDLRPCQYILLQCIELSSIEWHPFTVTKCPSLEDPSFNFLIGVRGDWTDALYDKIEIMKLRDDFKLLPMTIDRIRNQRLTFHLDGPFHSPLESLFRKKVIVCIAAGVGITPFMGAFNELIKIDLKKPERIHLVWVVKKFDQIIWFSSILESLLDKYWRQNEPDRLDVQLYITKHSDGDQINELFYRSNRISLSRIHQGRPVWDNYFDYLSFLYGKKTTMIYCSGPKKLTREIYGYCHKRNKIGYKYNFVHEGFN